MESVRKRKFVAFFLALAMVVSMVPSGVLAYAGDDEQQGSETALMGQAEGDESLLENDSLDGSDVLLGGSLEADSYAMLADENGSSSVTFPVKSDKPTEGSLTFTVDEVTVTAGGVATIKVSAKNDSTKQNSDNFTISSGSVNIQPSGTLSFSGPSGNQNVKKGETASWDFTASVPSDAMNGSYTVPVTITYNKTDYVLNVPITIKAATSDVILVSAADSGSQLSGYAQTYDQESLSFAFDMRNYNSDSSNYSWELSLKASDSASGELTDITSGVNPVWEALLPGSASEGASGTGTAVSNYNGTSMVSIDLSGIDPDQKNVAYEATLTVTDSSTGKVTTKKVSVYRQRNDLDNHTFYLINVGRSGSSEQSIIQYDTKKGTSWFDDLYYGNVADDDRVPFSDAESFRGYLLTLPENQVDAEFNKYIYDLYNPNSGLDKKNTDYADSNGKWVKDGNTPFHAVASSGVNNLTYSLSEGGVQYDEDYFKNLKKTATVEGRSGSIELSADTNPVVLEPRVYLIRTQGSWQMFDVAHATSDDGSGIMYNSVDSMANYYAVKQALLRFSEYLKEKSGGSAVLGFLTFSHAGEYSMFTGNGYLSNDADTIEAGLRGWDTFGDCEHSHYKDDLLEAALGNVSTELKNWKDSDGTLIGDQVKKTAIFIGGPCQPTENEGGYKVTLDQTLLTDTMDNSYAIRTVVGDSTATNTDGTTLYSWLDYGTNKNIWNAEGNGYYVAPSEDEIYESLVDIFEKDSTSDVTTYGNVNATVTDTVQKEFKVTGATATWTSAVDSSVTEVPQDSISIVVKEDGSTEVTCDYGECTGTGTVKLMINVEAQSDYVGGNDVLTNVGVPQIAFEHTNKKTGEKQEFTKKFTDKPTVNVSLLDLDVTGGGGLHKVGNAFNLQDHAKADLTDLLTGYPQTNGTLKIEWVETDDQGNPLENQTISFTANEYRVTGGSLNGQTIQPPSCEVNSDVAQTRHFQLKVTYTPDEATNGLPDAGTKAATAPVVLTWTDEMMVGLQIHKVDAATKSDLENVAFCLYEDAACTTIASVFTEEDFSAALSAAGAKTTSAGLAGFYGLEIGKTYYLKEITARAGYSLSGEVWTVKAESDERVSVNGIAANGSKVIPASGGDEYYLATMTVENQKNPDLPLSGMAGIGLLALAGSAFIAAGLSLSIRRCRLKGGRS